MERLKRTVCLVSALVFVGVFMAGCALFERNVKYDHNQVVARVGNDITITKRQLIDAFNSFGHQFVTQQGKSLSDAYNETLDMLINRAIIADISARTLGPLTEAEMTQARRVSYDAVERRFRNIEDEIRKERNWQVQSTPPASTDEPTGQTHTQFVPHLQRRGSGFVLNLERFRERPAQDFTHRNNEDFIDFLTMPRGTQNELERSITNEAFNRFVRHLQNAERGYGFRYNTDAEKRQAIDRELNRIQTEEKKNIKVRRMAEAFDFGVTPSLDGVARTSDGGLPRRSFAELNELRFEDWHEFEWEVHQNTNTHVEHLARTASEDFRSRLQNARFRYDSRFDTDAEFITRLLDNLSETIFAPRHIADQFFTVSHILIGYSDEQRAERERIEQRFNQDRNRENRDRDLALLQSQVTATRNVDGNPVGTPMTAEEVLRFVEQRVAPNSANKTLERKVRDFQSMIYMFNSDPGMFNAEFEYVIGADMRHDRSDRSQEEETRSRMVPEFTAAARELFNFNHAENRGNGTRGTMSGLVWTDFGAHIIMYTRNITDFIFTNTANLIDHEFEYFLHKTQTSYGTKTFFDSTIERLNRPTFNRFEQQLLADFKGEHKITIFRYRYRDLTR